MDIAIAVDTDSGDRFRKEEQELTLSTVTVGPDLVVSTGRAWSLVAVVASEARLGSAHGLGVAALIIALLGVHPTALHLSQEDTSNHGAHQLRRFRPSIANKNICFQLMKATEMRLFSKYKMVPLAGLHWSNFL